MHTEPMPETAGEFAAPKSSERPCRKCGAKAVTYEVWDSSCGGYEDEKYTCGACGHVWWVEGPDA